VAVSDIDVVRGYYEALAARDIERALAVVDESCVITQDDRLPWGGRYVGHEGFATFGLTLTSTIQSQVTHEALFEADGDVIQVGRTKGTVVATGVPFDIAEVHRWTIRDGKAVAAHFSIDTPAMLEALSKEA
jgi:ketosteroid isomerase-like protein